MSDFAHVLKHENGFSVIFNIEDNRILEIGNKMEAINDMAYMNGYNWEAFLNHYLSKNHPHLLVGLDHDPEAGTYASYYELGDENEKKANEFVSIIKHLVENESKILEVVKTEGDQIEWD